MRTCTMAKIAEWLNALVESEAGTNGDFLREVLVNVAKAVIALLDALGEWPIDVQ